MTLKEQPEELFKMHPWQEAILREKQRVMYDGRMQGKKVSADFMTNVRLSNMKKDQTFGLVTPEGIRIFRLEEIRK